MAFLDEIGKTLADKSKEAAQKAKGVAEVLQLKAQISSENSKVKELYGAIGALYFKNNREEPADDYQMFFPEIEKTLAHIAEMEAKVKELEGIRCCDICGAPLRKNDIFCSKCGAQQAVTIAEYSINSVCDKECRAYGYLIRSMLFLFRGKNFGKIISRAF